MPYFVDCRVCKITFRIFLSSIRDSGNFCSKECWYSYKKGKDIGKRKGKKASIETRIKQSEASKKMLQSPEVRKRMSESAKGNTNAKGHSVSEEARERISKANKGKKASKETRKKMSEALKGNTHGFQKGKPGYWRGKKFSEETKRKMSLATKGKPRFNRRRENNPNWKGGVQRNRHKGDWRYTNWRNKVFQYDDYTCWICENVGGRLVGHHLKKWSDYPELRFIVSNGTTLCEFCHKTYTKFK